MVAVVLSIIITLLLAFNNQAFAKGFGASICTDAGYTCYIAKRGDTWSKLFPDEAQRDLVMRVNRMNTRLHSGMKIAIPDSLEASLLDHSPFPIQINAPGEKIIYVSKSNLAFAAYDDTGSLQHWGPISSAKGYCPDIRRGCHTPSGNFAITYKQGRGCVSTKYPVGRGGAPMPYCMFFHGGYALHGSYDVPGYNASHGCIRLFVDDARWLNQEFTADEGHVRVVVY